jgi:hypothetical protein
VGYQLRQNQRQQQIYQQQQQMYQQQQQHYQQQLLQQQQEIINRMNRPRTCYTSRYGHSATTTCY